MLEQRRTEEELDWKQAEEKRKWFFRENVRLEQQRRELEDERAQLEQQKKEFQRKQEMAEARNRFERRQIEQERRLFELKWKVLEDELVRLARDKRKVEQEKKACRDLKASQHSRKIHYEVFFVGVNSRQSLKKRYRELLKIFHPDNLDGDKATLQEINREYDNLKKIFI